jgi:hypothetical protein
MMAPAAGDATQMAPASDATMATPVALAVGPVADMQAQPPVIQTETVPGRFSPQVPHEPDPVYTPPSIPANQPLGPA